MAHKRSLPLILLSFSATTMQSGAQESPSTTTPAADIAEFYNTGSLIWSYSLMTDSSRLCKVDFDINTTSTGTTFYRYMAGINSGRNPKVTGAHRRDSSRELRLYHLTGKFRYAFIRDETFNTMDLTYQEGHGISFTETIEIESPDRKCAIFSVNLRMSTQRNPKVSLEFRIKSSRPTEEETKNCFDTIKHFAEEKRKTESTVSSELITSHKCVTVCSGNEVCQNLMLTSSSDK
uniref:Putative lipocalin-3 1 n=1 Tax=Amblyomma parvum TaxID=251391 RepID=A0A023FT74_AMBPA